jgi:predicted GIY-YIG superfamily endonuclease
VKPFFVYMLRCKDGSYYVGHTDDLEQRIAQHADGTFGGYTCKRRPVELVWVAELDTRDEALQREMQVKPWSRAKKEALIRSEWDELKRLARGQDRSRPSTPPGLRPGYARDERNVAPRGGNGAREERNAAPRGGNGARDERNVAPRGGSGALGERKADPIDA